MIFACFANCYHFPVSTTKSICTTWQGDLKMVKQCLRSGRYLEIFLGRHNSVGWWVTDRDGPPNQHVGACNGSRFKKTVLFLLSHFSSAFLFGVLDFSEEREAGCRKWAEMKRKSRWTLVNQRVWQRLPLIWCDVDDAVRASNRCKGGVGALGNPFG